MSFPDEGKSIPATFTGDSDVFDLPDAFLQSPTTTERVVDTQSGFLVVIKRQNERVSVSVKRRLGTPPSSSVLLTPDESLKLSRILATSLTAEEFQRERMPRAEMRRRIFSRPGEEISELDITGEHDIVPPGEGYGNAGRGSGIADVRGGLAERPASGRGGEGIDGDEPDWTTLEQEALAGVAAARARRGRRKFFGIANFSPRMIVVSGAVALALAAAGISAGLLLSHIFNPASDPETVIVPNPLTPAKIDRFARVYVADLLDFNPDTYKVSQIQAMSHMSQELLESYWKETGFPLTKAQLKSLPQTSTVLIMEIQQKPIDLESAQVDIYAEMGQAGSKVTTPIHLKLKLGSTADGTIRVIEQKDITASAPSPTPATPSAATSAAPTTASEPIAVPGSP